MNIKEPIKIQNSNTEQLLKDNQLDTKIRRMQAIYGQRSLLLCLPIEFTRYLSISKGDYVKCSIAGSGYRLALRYYQIKSMK